MALFIGGFVVLIVIFLLTKLEYGVDQVIDSKVLEGKVTKIGLVDGSKSSNPEFFAYIAVAELKHPVMVRIPSGVMAKTGKTASIICKIFESGREKCSFEKYASIP